MLMHMRVWIVQRTKLQTAIIVVEYIEMSTFSKIIVSNQSSTRM